MLPQNPVPNPSPLAEKDHLTRNRIFVALIIVLVGLAIVQSNKGGGSKTSHGTVPTAGLSDVPIPDGATPSRNTGTIRTYHMPSAMSYAELEAFYDQRMPKGKDWQGWAWCRSTSGPAESGYQRSYASQATGQSLVVSTFPPGGGYSAGLMVGTNEDDADGC